MASKLRFLHRAWRYRWLVDRAELRFVRGRIRPGQVVVDVGCHKGAYTYWLRRGVGATGEVFAFEPQPRQVAYLRGVLQAMRYTNVTLVPMGLSDVPGRLRLHIPKAPGATHEASFVAAKGGHSACDVVEAEVTTLDAFFAGRARQPDFIKIDVEGHESAVLAGARATLVASRPTLLIECEARHRPDRDVHSLFALLESLGYEGSFFRRGKRRPLREFRPDEHQPAFVDSARQPSGYVNNFAFEHPSRA
jgi:FkbM family methyltransferase